MKKIADISEMAKRRAKQGDICDSQVVVTCIWGIFDLLVFKILNWGYLVHLSQNRL